MDACSLPGSIIGIGWNWKWKWNMARYVTMIIRGKDMHVEERLLPYRIPIHTTRYVILTSIPTGYASLHDTDWVPPVSRPQS